MLTDKEKQVLVFRKKGLKQAQIAAKLKISQPAVSAFENNAIRKIDEAKETMEFIKSLGAGYDKK